MNHLLRDLAPITTDAWSMIDDEAKSRLSVYLGARRVVDFSGPHGWTHSATSLGRVGPVASAPFEGVIAQSRSVLPLAEVRADFTLQRSELENISRGALDVDLDPVDEAARRIASVENAAVFSGWGELGMTGILEASPHDPIVIGDEPRAFALRVAEAVARLKDAAVGGPYALGVSYDEWVNVTGNSDQGGTILQKHLERILGGPVEWIPGLETSVVVSLRGGDFIFESGQDLSIGYASHTSRTVDLYLQETFSFRVVTPEAAIALV